MLAKMLYGYIATQCLYVAAKLNIADHLVSGSKSINELAKLTDTRSNSLYRVMRCLAALGVFQEEADEIYSLNREADALRSDSENTLKDFIILCGEELYQSTGSLLYSVKTGLPAFDHIYGMNHWEFLENHSEKAEIFHDAMERGSESTLKKIVDSYDFSPYKKIIDVGGGKGHLLCKILSEYPNIHGVTFDLPNAKIFAHEFINKKSLTKRCDFVAGNFFASVPENGDLYLLQVVLHDWDDESARLILKNCRKEISKLGKVLIIEKVIVDNKFKKLACLGDINMLVNYTGRERTLLELQSLLSESGFRFTKKLDTKTVFSIIEAEPAE